MTWKYVAKRHYSKPDGNGGTIHVAGGAVYITHPSKATVDVTGAKADKYIASATGRPKSRAPAKPTTATKPGATPKKTKKSLLTSVKKGARLIVVVTRPVAATAVKYGARVAAAGEMAVASTAAAEKRVLTPPPVKKTPAKKKKTPAKKKKTPAKKKSAPRAKAVTAHPLSYLLSGTDALPPTARRPPAKKHREQTLREFMGY